MTDGSRRVEVPYLWPPTLLLPARPPKLVYLDLNHWVTLAKANTGHRDGTNYAETLEACREAARRDVAVFPLSGTIFIEISKIGSIRQRRDLRDVIEEISGFVVVTSKSVVAAHEIEAMLDVLAGPSPTPVNTMDYLDWGVARAFGMNGALQVFKDGQEASAEARELHPDGPAAFDALIRDAQVELQRRVLDGPSPEEEPEMRAAGWDPAATIKVGEQRAAQEREQADRFDEDPRWRKGRIRDVIAARELAVELLDTLTRGLADREVTFADVFTSTDDARRAFDALPSFDVAVTLKSELHRNALHPWTANDIYDIDALAVTVPYVDVVVTDRAMAHRVQTTGLADRLSTAVLADLKDLPVHL